MNTYLESYSTQELQEEINRRNSVKPQPRDYCDINWTIVYDYIRDAVDELDEGYLPDDFEQGLVEAVVNTVYENDIWDWWRDKQ